jgi:hypothetical protein
MTARVGRIRRLTVESINTKLQREAEARVAYYATRPEEIEARLRELDQEWDIERAIEMESATTILTGAVFGITFSRKWFLLSAFASAMLLVHTLHGQYPLLPLFRRMGFRTANEIAQERYALKVLRGDFQRLDDVEPEGRVRQAFNATGGTPQNMETIPVI